MRAADRVGARAEADERHRSNAGRAIRRGPFQADEGAGAGRVQESKAEFHFGPRRDEVESPQSTGMAGERCDGRETNGYRSYSRYSICRGEGGRDHHDGGQYGADDSLRYPLCEELGRPAYEMMFTTRCWQPGK